MARTLKGKESSGTASLGCSLGMVAATTVVPAGNGSSKHTAQTELRLDASAFGPGSVLLLRVETPKTNGVFDSSDSMPSRLAPSTEPGTPGIDHLGPALIENKDVTLSDLSVLLFRSEHEEKDDTNGAQGTYGLPDIGLLPWAGAMGLFHPLVHVARWNDTAHPLCRNLRDGLWLADYMIGRLERRPALAQTRKWLANWIDRIKTMHPGLRPQGFERVVRALIHASLLAVLARMKASPLLAVTKAAISAAWHAASSADSGTSMRKGSGEPLAVDVNAKTAFAGADSGIEAGEELFSIDKKESEALQALGVDFRRIIAISNNFYCSCDGYMSSSAALKHFSKGRKSLRPTFLCSLLLTSVMLVSEVKSAPLMDPRLPLLPSPTGSGWVGYKASLAAGVDHFCTGFMRNWGRDTFIALRGLLLLPGRFEEARMTLLAYASVVRHGLVPNLMDGGRNPRYNARDATWFWLQGVKDYCCLAPEGTGILSAKVRRRFPSDSMDDYHEDPTTGLTVPKGGWREP